MIVRKVRQGPPHAESGDAALVRACLDGDEDAWAELVDRYGRLVYSIPRRVGLSAADADDVFQNVFTALYRRLAGLRDQTRLSSWLITITYRECWRIGRLARPTVEIDDAIVDTCAPPAEEVARWQREQQVREALGRIDGRCRALLTALFLDPAAPSYETIGARLNMPVGSIGPTRARCFKKLEAVLREMGVDREI